MKHCEKEMTMKNTKADILNEYHRLRDKLMKIHHLTVPFAGDLKSILKKSKPCNEIENSTSVPPNSTNDDYASLDVLGMIKNKSKKSRNTSKSTVSHQSNGRPSRYNGNAKGKRNDQQPDKKPEIRLVCDPDVSKHMQKVKQGRVDKQPLWRSTRQRPAPNLLDRYISSMLK